MVGSGRLSELSLRQFLGLEVVLSNGVKSTKFSQPAIDHWQRYVWPRLKKAGDNGYALILWDESGLWSHIVFVPNEFNMKKHLSLAIPRLFFLCCVLVFAAVLEAQHGVIDYYAALAPSAEATPLTPLFDEPLTDTSIALADDGFYYLTGTKVVDEMPAFSQNVTIWRSPDKTNWEIVRNLAFKDKKVASPEIHWLDDSFFLTVGLENGGTELLKFATGDLASSEFTRAKVTEDGCDPSLFLDDDGTFYWVYGAGMVARMKADPLEGLAEAATNMITPYPERAGDNKNAQLVRSTRMRGAFMAKINGFYHLFVGERRLKFNDLGRTGLPGGTDDTFVAVSDKPTAGFNQAYRYLAFPSAGQVTLFRDKDGSLWSTYSCTDIRGIFRLKPGAFPVEIVDASKPVWPTGFSGQDQPVLYMPHYTMLRPDRRHIYENGVGLAKSIPFDPVPDSKRDLPWIRDTNVARGGDGNYYMTGTAGDIDAVHLWKSTDMKKFDYFTEAFRFRKPEESPEIWYNQKPARLLWAPEIHYLNDNYWITYSVNVALGMGFLKSASGKPQGPYVQAYEGNRAFVAPHIDSSLFHDTDGKSYYVWQGKFLRQLNKDYSGFVEKRVELLTVDDEQVGYEGIYLVKIKDWYVLCAAEWNGGNNRMDGTYDTMYAVSKNLEGPYSSRRVLVPHSGHSSLFQSNDSRDGSGQWHLSFFGNDRTAPFRASVGIVPLKVIESESDLRLELDLNP